MSSTPRTKRNDADRDGDFSGLSTAMVRDSRRIQRALSEEKDEIRPRLAVISADHDTDGELEIRPSEIRKIAAYVRAHRRRDLLFSPGIFGDPAWDMLLDLFIAKGEARQVSMDSICLAAGVPASTAWRKFATLEEAGLVTRHADPDDRRRTHVELTMLAVENVQKWLGQLGDCAPGSSDERD